VFTQSQLRLLIDSKLWNPQSRSAASALVSNQRPQMLECRRQEPLEARSPAREAISLVRVSREGDVGDGPPLKTVRAHWIDSERPEEASVAATQDGRVDEEGGIGVDQPVATQPIGRNAPRRVRAVIRRSALLEPRDGSTSLRGRSSSRQSGGREGVPRTRPWRSVIGFASGPEAVGQ